MKEIGSLARLLLLVALAAGGAACGEPEGTDAALTPAEAQALVQRRPRPPEVIFGRVAELDLPLPADGNFSRFPAQIAPGRGDDLWFRDQYAELGHITKHGNEISFVAAPAGLGIALGSDGNVWFGTQSGIARLTHSGAIDEFALPDVGGPQDLVAGHDGNLWALGFDHVARVTTEGVATSFAMPTPSSSSGDHMALGPDGAVWFTNRGMNLLGRVTPAGAITEFAIGAGGALFGIAAGDDGTVWFTRQGGNPGENSIGHLTRRGVASTVVQLPDSTTTLPNPPNGMPMALAAGRDGNMYFTTYFELEDNYIGQVSEAGCLTKFDIPTGGAASFGITADRSGTVWFTEIFNNSIGRLNVTRGPTVR